MVNKFLLILILFYFVEVLYEFYKTIFNIPLYINRVKCEIQTLPSLGFEPTTSGF